MVRARSGPCEECGDPAGRDDANSYLPFTGRLDLKQAVSARVADRSGVTYDPEAEIVVTATEGDALLDVLLALTDPGDEVIFTDFTYAGDAEPCPSGRGGAP